ncbi:hypothetical protein LHJ74_06615 [Streptomyces sp. N2-109]|uniref:Beta-ketoacyl synthase n=1 Tax=Streptomyces gossypii TaxID=2883101 RepID=A0ABT2JNZ5_9ACTN|nr:beta-ketoacyl synthase N-terminal-like domain-containing protein [Streptomyces gossypii]MCT2589598.1 hypothetical protein [Streptomyces gossypii]
MTDTMAITGLGVLSGAGIGAPALAGALSAPQTTDVSEMFEEPLPGGQAHALADFKVRDHLGRKGTSFYDRSTAFGVVACQEALADSALEVDDENRTRVGIVLGTTAGSVKSSWDYTTETLTQERPYLVNPVLFPNAVMNCTAGQAAIRHNLRGPNATVAGGPLAMLNVLRYSRNLLNCGYADALLSGSIEEFGPQEAWRVHHAQSLEGGDLLPGEGAAVFVIESAEAVRAAGRTPDVEVLAVETGVFDPASAGSGLADGLTLCLSRALERAGVTAGQVSTVATAANGMTRLDEAEEAAINAVLGSDVPRLEVKEATGETSSASGALQLAALLARHRGGEAGDGDISVITSRDEEGAAGAAVIRGWNRAHGDNG